MVAHFHRVARRVPVRALVHVGATRAFGTLAQLQFGVRRCILARPAGGLRRALHFPVRRELQPLERVGWAGQAFARHHGAVGVDPFSRTAEWLQLTRSQPVLSLFLVAVCTALRARTGGGSRVNRNLLPHPARRLHGALGDPMINGAHVGVGRARGAGPCFNG